MRRVCTFDMLASVIFGVLIVPDEGQKHSWCQSQSHASCVGQRHLFEEREDLLEKIDYANQNNWPQFGDWDDDGDLDFIAGICDPSFANQRKGCKHMIQLIFYERLSNASFLPHNLVKFNSTHPDCPVISFAIADWNSDGKLDLLFCTLGGGTVTVSWLNHSFATPEVADAEAILFVEDFYEPADDEPVYGPRKDCHMQLVDFDEDGDTDLILGTSGLGQRYFERMSEKLVERIGEQSPLFIFDGLVQVVADMDGDGRVEILMQGWQECGYGDCDYGLRYFHRAADNTFVEPAENPFKGFHLESNEGWTERAFVADWNSDALPDFLVVRKPWFGNYKVTYFEHIQDLNLARNSQMNQYESILVESDTTFHELHAIDWNKDGALDVLISKASIRPHIIGQRLLLHEIDGQNVRTIDIKAFEEFASTHLAGYRLAIADFDGDGDLDFLIASNQDRKLHYHETVQGLLEKEKPNHLFSNITIGENDYVQPVAVDWDNDGDIDLVLGPPDYRFFEQLDNSTMKEWRLEDSPFRHVKMKSFSSRYTVWRFIDCDADGDRDLIRLDGGRLQACEHVHGKVHALNCRDDFPCLGANLSGLTIESFDLGEVYDGKLNLIATNTVGQGGRARLWSAGFCKPKTPCHQKGLCLSGQRNCSCVAGHELFDCSGCQANFYTVKALLGNAHDCKACPGENGLPCYGRGQCFDDAAAKLASQKGTAALLALGNGSCSCNERYFSGFDSDGRRTCALGFCPAGTEELEGKCVQCAAGSHSSPGGACKKCAPGTFGSRSGCSSCLPGTVSEVFGMSACEECPAGKHEVNGQVCSDCPAGYISSSGDTCTKCPQGSHASSQGSSKCDACPAGTFAEAGSVRCATCPGGTISSAGSGSCHRCIAGHLAIHSTICKLCPAGSFAGAGDQTCQICPAGQVSTPDRVSCRSCNSILIRRTPDFSKQTCHINALEVIFAVVFWMAGTCFWLIFFIGLYGRLPVADVSPQGEKWVITTSLPHFLLKRASGPGVTFSDTDVQLLDSAPAGSFTVKTLSSYQLTLQCNSPPTTSLDTSMGQLRMKFPQPFFVTGLLNRPLICWCLVLMAMSVAAASRLTWSLSLVVLGLNLFAAGGGFALLLRRGQRTPLAQRRREFLNQWPLHCNRCSRGPGRSLQAGILRDFLQFFDSFIKDRSMYYVCYNIVKPLTKPYQMSFAELVGPTTIEWFVSHYWGMPVRHFVDAIYKHALSSRQEWQESAYWICTFSNSQWHINEELGDGRWQDSSFYLALRSLQCRGTAMIIDELVQPLNRIWCLFEVYQTICLSHRANFQGLLLCTSMGVLQEGKAGTDVAVAVAETVARLDTRRAQATSEDDRLMIHGLVEKMPGGFDTMNTFVRDTIHKALEASHGQFEAKFQRLVQSLTSDAQAESASSVLPTLLTSAPKNSKSG